MQITLLSWNIKCGCNSGLLQNGWPKRRLPLKEALTSERFDVLCVQEALLDQLRFIDTFLPHYRRFGVGRTDGVASGEHCAIYALKDRFERTDDGTFWLSTTPKKPSRSFDPPPLPPRICSWVALRDHATGKRARIFNTHFPLGIAARKKSAEVLVSQMNEIHPGLPALLSGDFNCRPGTAPRKTIHASGLSDVEFAFSGKNESKTWHLRGIPVICLDGIYASPRWKVLEFRMAKPKTKVQPSDHYGLLTTVSLVK